MKTTRRPAATKRIPRRDLPAHDPRTPENWEQGRANPNAQAALLIGLVRKVPDMVARLAGASSNAAHLGSRRFRG